MKFKGLTFLFILLLMTSFASGQTIEQLKAQKLKTAKEINYINNLLQQTGDDSKTSINRLAIINHQIELREELLNTFEAELTVLQQSINDNTFVVESLTDDLNQIKENYAKLVRQAYKSRDNYNELVFIFSSSSFNQAYKRLLYLRQITQYRKKQIEQIAAIKQILEVKVEELNQQQIEKAQLLTEQKEAYSLLNAEKEKQLTYLLELQKKEKDLKQKLRKQQRLQARIDNEIERLIEEEALINAGKRLTPEMQLISDNFEKNKGRFPWPTIHGIITDKFGEHPHPALKTIMIRNNGIDITTTEGEKARAIFKGTVSRVFAIPGGNKAVIIRHGEYISVYSNLSEVLVNQGDAVETKQAIGTIFTDKASGNKTVLKFQVWKENQKLNPELWIAK